MAAWLLPLAIQPASIKHHILTHPPRTEPRVHWFLGGIFHLLWQMTLATCWDPLFPHRLPRFPAPSKSLSWAKLSAFPLPALPFLCPLASSDNEDVACCAAKLLHYEIVNVSQKTIRNLHSPARWVSYVYLQKF